MSFKTDLHIHSWYSDGTESPTDIVERYAKDKYELIAITDHEVTDGIEEAIEAGKDKNLRVIPGVEIATVFKGKELHILGYYFDISNQKLQEELGRLAETRRKRNIKLLEALRGMGVDIEESDLIQREGQNYIGKPNFARALIKKGYISDISQAFERGKYLMAQEAVAIEREKPETEDIIRLITEVGGMAVLAHPCKIKGLGERESRRFKEAFGLLIKELKDIGLKGLECIYPKHTEEEKFFFIGEAAKYHLHITEGSDFHGDR